MFSRRRCWHFASFFSAACVLAICALGAAVAAPAQAIHSATEFPDSRVDIYGGYGYFHPISSGIAGHQFFDVYNPNATVSVTGWFNRYIGVATEGSYFSGNSEHRVYDPVCASTNCDQLLYTAQAGPIARYPLGPFIPFAHALGGGVRMNGPVTQPLTWGWGVTGGIGLDYMLPFFSKKIAIRAFQADYQICTCRPSTTWPTGSACRARRSRGPCRVISSGWPSGRWCTARCTCPQAFRAALTRLTPLRFRAA